MMLFKTPSIEDLIAKELEAAQRGLLEATRNRDYYESLITFHQRRIKYLLESKQ